MVKLQKSFIPLDLLNAEVTAAIMKCSRFDPEAIFAHLPEHLKMSICEHELEEEDMVKNVIADCHMESVQTEDIGIMTDPERSTYLKDYKNLQAHNYSKHEQTFVPLTTNEEALRNAKELIDSERKANAKAEKKEAEKKRQKERKKADKTNADKTSLKDANANFAQIENIENHENDGNLVSSDSEDQIDINAAFVKVSVKRNKNISTNTNSSSKPEKANNSSITSGSTPKFVKPNHNRMSHEAAEKLGIQSYQLALNCSDFGQAADQLSQAIFLAPDDIRHFLNRSYCYLRLGQYTSALDDAEFAKKSAQSMDIFAKAVAREGQALCGLRQYHEAEKCFEETLKLGQASRWIIGELILVRTFQLTSMGFSKINALKALQQCSTVADAVTLLTSGNISSPELETNVNESEIENNDVDEIYFSDDESSSTSILLSKLVSALADESCYFENLQSQSFSSKAQPYTSFSERTIKSSSSMESITRGNDIKHNGNTQWEVSGGSKSFSTTSKAQSQKIIQSESNAIWVGSIESSITDLKLREAFSKFGPIDNIRRFPDKRFVFINFQSKKAATKALNYPTDIEINGIKLPIKPTPGTFVKK